MVNPVPVDFEHQHQETEHQDTSGSFIPTASIEETTTTVVSVPKTCRLFEVIVFRWKQMKDFCTRTYPVDDVRFRVGMPVVSLIVTLVALSFFVFSIVDYGRGWNWNNACACILYFAYFILAASAAFELWWGLKTNDKKHINVWILLKCVEIFATIYAFLYCLIYGRTKRFFEFCPTLFYYFLIMGLNSWILYVVLQSTKPLRDKDKRQSTENEISTISRS